ncbi:hypothetical protein IAU60_005961 [Kwoniella sp. DSM 27419]
MPAASAAGLASVDYTNLSKTELYFSFSLVSSLFFLWGLSYGLLDVLNKHFLDHFGLEKVESTLLQFAYFIAYLLVAPPMGVFMRKYGYKKGIHIGLGLFAIGAILFWPSAVYEKYGMFLAFTFVCGSGMATLEAAASSYIAVLGPPRYAAFRLTLAQAFNGVATVLGPIIAANTFFVSSNKGSLDTVQYVYVALAAFATLINIGLFFAKLPEVSQAVTVDQQDTIDKQGFFKQYHCIFGAIAQFFYVGAQVAVASFAIFYMTEQPGIENPYDSATASNMFSACQAVFTVGRFFGVFYLRWIDPSFALFINGIGLCLFSILTATVTGKGGIACLFMIFFFESVCYPVIFSVATADLGSFQKIGSGVVALGVSGGAAYPSLQGLVADKVSSHRSYFIPLTGFVPLLAYGFFMWIRNSRRYGGKLSIWSQNTTLNVEEHQAELATSGGLAETDSNPADNKETDVFQEEQQKPEMDYLERR